MSSPAVTHPGVQGRAGRVRPFDPSIRLRAGSAQGRPLNRPRPVRVEAGEDGAPIAVWLLGRRCPVQAVLEVWRIDDEWWRQRPVSRVYYRLLLEEGRTVTLYRDLMSQRWAKQAY